MILFKQTVAFVFKTKLSSRFELNINFLEKT